jgi:hypothetical protein
MEAGRINMRDAKSYCPILLDDNNRKTICRLHFNNPERLRIGIINEAKAETLYDLQRVEDIYKHAHEVAESAKRLA